MTGHIQSWIWLDVIVMDMTFAQSSFCDFKMLLQRFLRNSVYIFSTKMFFFFNIISSSLPIDCCVKVEQSKISLIWGRQLSHLTFFHSETNLPLLAAISTEHGRIQRHFSLTPSLTVQLWWRPHLPDLKTRANGTNYNMSHVVKTHTLQVKNISRYNLIFHILLIESQNKRRHLWHFSAL